MTRLIPNARRPLFQHSLLRQGPFRVLPDDNKENAISAAPIGPLNTSSVSLLFACNPYVTDCAVVAHHDGRKDRIPDIMRPAAALRNRGG